jgi:hypothetical protein
MKKYKISINDIERKGGVAKLERDGFKREDIMKSMYKATDGADTTTRRKLVQKLFNRQEPC